MQAGSRVRWLWWLLAYTTLAIGMIGIVLPVLPTVPFILLAAFAAARGSERLHRQLLDDPRTGPMIEDWNRNRSIARRAKVIATVTMVVSAVVVVLVAPALWIPLVVIAIMLTVGTWIWLRPES